MIWSALLSQSLFTHFSLHKAFAPLRGDDGQAFQNLSNPLSNVESITALNSGNMFSLLYFTHGYHAQISKDLEGQFKKITVSDDDVKKYYEDNKEYRTAHILYRLRAEPTPDEVKAAYEQTMAIYAQLQKTPEDFAKMANKYSQTSAAPVGGDLGFQPPTRLAPEYFEAIKGQKAGFISKPTRSQMGYHIIKVLGVKSFEQIDKNLYKKIIYDKKRDALMDEYFKGLAQGVVIKKNI
jgi:parvulin-like peptidyl-prolyl isomerase